MVNAEASTAAISNRGRLDTCSYHGNGNRNDEDRKKNNLSCRGLALTKECHELKYAKILHMCSYDDLSVGPKTNNVTPGGVFSLDTDDISTEHP